MLHVLSLLWLVAFGLIAQAQGETLPRLLLCGDFSGASDPSIDTEKERACLLKTKGTASRDGCKLILQLEGGPTKIYEDWSETCGLSESQQDRARQYKLLAWLPDRHMFILWVSWYESMSTILISSRTGSEQPAWTGLHLSPDANTIAEINNEDGGASADYSIAIWDLTVDPARLAFKHAPTDYESWQFAGWRNSNTVLATVTKHIPDRRGALVTFTAALTRDGSQRWNLTITDHPKPHE